MNSGQTFSRREAEALLGAAARVPSEAPSTDLTIDELTEAAAGAGIGTTQLDIAIRIRSRRRERFILAGTAIAIAGITAALVLSSRVPTASSDVRLLRIHNEQRRRGVRLEVLVPAPTARAGSRCTDAPTQRVAAQDYCRLIRTWLAPGARLRLRTPDAPRGCPQAWVRAVGDTNGRQVSALVTLPVSIEIERTGKLDQKGIASPNMHPAPDDEAAPVNACSEGTEGGHE